MDKESIKKAKEKAAPRFYGKDAYPFEIKYCPGYEGYKPENLSSEVCKYCGGHYYYH